MVTTGELQRLRKVVGEVQDPEIPVLTIEDLGVLRDLALDEDCVVVTITPTYSGCPAMDMIREEVLSRLREEGVQQARVKTALSPAWTTDWMSEDGRRKLREYGIAPPARCAQPQLPQLPQLTQLSVCCPACGSFDTRQVSRFGSTACKAHYVCEACDEPFDHFKTI
jgi:ring-1,2-phenylacetyl-CoA epoxidase subunit PaaD